MQQGLYNLYYFILFLVLNGFTHCLIIMYVENYTIIFIYQIAIVILYFLINLYHIIYSIDSINLILINMSVPIISIIKFIHVFPSLLGTQQTIKSRISLLNLEQIFRNQM